MAPQNQRLGLEGDFEVPPCLEAGLAIGGKFPQNDMNWTEQAWISSHR
jgi:hypothetical protein